MLATLEKLFQRKITRVYKNTSPKAPPGETHLLAKNPESLGPIHFVGIGGIGMSALALALHKNGYHIQGSDLSKSPMIDMLLNAGIQVFSSHTAENIKHANVLVVSSAISMRNAEVIAAQKKGGSIIKRGALLGHITKRKPTIGITGSHGKTTTTSLVGALLVNAHMDPLILAGGLMHQHKSNVYLGQGSYLVAELDESDGTHKEAHSHIGIVTNIDREHMAFYKTEQNLLNTFQQFFEQIKGDGTGIACADDPLVQRVIPTLSNPLLTYGTRKNASVHLTKIKAHKDGVLFDAQMPDGSHLRDIFLAQNGYHNMLNAGAAITAAFVLGINEETIRQTFRHFKGVKRRFQTTGTLNGVRIIDDYAHHPTEITATLKAAKPLCEGRLFAVCEPHRYTRLKDHFEDFATSLTLADHVITVPVFSAGEAPLQDVTSAALAHAINKQQTPSIALDSFDATTSYLSKVLRKGDVVVCMGAGKITNLAHSLPTSPEKRDSV